MHAEKKERINGLEAHPTTTPVAKAERSFRGTAYSHGRNGVFRGGKRGVSLERDIVVCNFGGRKCASAFALRATKYKAVFVCVDPIPAATRDLHAHMVRCRYLPPMFLL